MALVQLEAKQGAGIVVEAMVVQMKMMLLQGVTASC